MSRPSLDGSYLKLARAHKHLDALQVEVNGILKRDSHEALVVIDRKKAQVAIVARVLEPPPRKWGTTIGDALFNLRSALDHAAWSLAELVGSPPDGTEFPIFKNGDAYARLDKRQRPARGSGLYKVRGLPDDAQAIIKRLQPFSPDSPWTPLHPGWVLHRLNNIDKHRFLHIADLIVASFNVTFDREVGDVRVIHMEGQEAGRFTNEAELARFQLIDAPSGDIKMHVEIEVGFDVAFNEPEAEGATVFEFFNAAYNWVARDVLRRLEDFFD